jgi:hypothetical protein
MNLFHFTADRDHLATEIRLMADSCPRAAHSGLIAPVAIAWARTMSDGELERNYRKTIGVLEREDLRAVRAMRVAWAGEDEDAGAPLDSLDGLSDAQRREALEHAAGDASAYAASVSDQALDATLDLILPRLSAERLLELRVRISEVWLRAHAGSLN